MNRSLPRQFSLSTFNTFVGHKLYPGPSPISRGALEPLGGEPSASSWSFSLVCAAVSSSSEAARHSTSTSYLPHSSSLSLRPPRPHLVHSYPLSVDFSIRVFASLISLAHSRSHSSRVSAAWASSRSRSLQDSSRPASSWHLCVFVSSRVVAPAGN